MTDPETGLKTLIRNEHEHEHGHNHAQAHDHHHEGDDAPHVHGPGGEVISLETAILGKNNEIATRNRGWFEGRGVIALNIVSSPGSGKTTLLEATIRRMRGRAEIAVIEGDQMTSNDAERIREAGARAIQINTGAGCHLEADMIASAVKSLDPAAGTILMIENVGNLVCPAMFDLGEKMKIAVISTTEGEDKPTKYPHMFRAVDWVVINKMDLAPHVDFDEASCRQNILDVNPKAEILCVSARTGDGMDAWCSRLANLLKEFARAGA
ncbi:hydrogenase nickel incorporation protein HypB [Roseovarius sp. A-2]|uniref:hydrogenase nickel incorporation protein HypB n=1 Tax=Roseovarius sp. A-2 TaxID=1570360 RepID=UPI0020CB3F20|nr:hydrogenase nickel incorporation protein HypB [Roseovarius sp. A-2]